jgi:hypothetical protein
MGNPRPRESSLVVYQQNVRGLGEAKIEELVWQMKRLNVYAWTLQETWRSGREILRNGDLNTDAGDDDFIILTNGWWNLGLALQGKQPFVTFSYLTPLFAPLKGSSSPLSSSFQAASRGVLGQTKKYFFGAALWPCI